MTKQIQGTEPAHPVDSFLKIFTIILILSILKGCLHWGWHEILATKKRLGGLPEYQGMFGRVSRLRARVYIYIRQLSSFRAPTLWFIDLTVATCHIQHTFLSLCQFFFTRYSAKSAIFV